MVGRVKAGDLRQTGKGFGKGTDASQVVWLVQRRQRTEPFKFVQHKIVDQAGDGEIDTAMNDAYDFKAMEINNIKRDPKLSNEEKQKKIMMKKI